MLATFNELAEAELNDAIGYYETEQIGLGPAFLAEIRHSTAAIMEFAEASPIIRGTVHRRLCARDSGDLHDRQGTANRNRELSGCRGRWRRHQPFDPMQLASDVRRIVEDAAGASR